MDLLLISNSSNAGEGYLQYCSENIRTFLPPSVDQVLFIPYAAVTFSFNDYEQKVQDRFAEIGVRVVSIHHTEKPVEAVRAAQAIVVGGGNTWQLARYLHQMDLIEPIRDRVMKGTPYVGWSAGSNVACPTIMTTNDMPITDPMGFQAFDLIPFQINPHYLDANPDGHAGETREQRILEFITVNPDLFVVGLRESTMLEIHDQQIRLIGSRPIRLFRKGQEPKELHADEDLGFLLLR